MYRGVRYMIRFFNLLKKMIMFYKYTGIFENLNLYFNVIMSHFQRIFNSQIFKVLSISQNYEK